MDLIGKNFGSYKIAAKIGEGGMGVVYRARDTDLDRPVAIKMVLESGGKDGSQSTEAVARFLREAKAAGLIDRLPRLAVVQAEGSAPFYEFVEALTKTGGGEFHRRCNRLSEWSKAIQRCRT